MSGKPERVVPLVVPVPLSTGIVIVTFDSDSRFVIQVITQDILTNQVP